MKPAGLGRTGDKPVRGHATKVMTAPAAADHSQAARETGTVHGPAVRTADLRRIPRPGRPWRRIRSPPAKRSPVIPPATGAPITASAARPCSLLRGRGRGHRPPGGRSMGPMAGRRRRVRPRRGRRPGPVQRTPPPPTGGPAPRRKAGGAIACGLASRARMVPVCGSDTSPASNTGLLLSLFLVRLVPGFASGGGIRRTGTMRARELGRRS